MLLVAVNLRPAITSLGALLDEVRTGLHLSGTVAGLVTALPPLAFSVIGSFTPWLVRRFSPARVTVGAMAVLAAGQALRAVTGSILVFILSSALALAGIAIENVLLPMLVKQYFPHRIGLVTGAYTMMMAAGTTVASAAAVPVAHAFGSWQAGLGIWALMAAVSILPWLPRALRGTDRYRADDQGSDRVHRADEVDADPAPTGDQGVRVRPARTVLGWAMAGYFGMQALGAYAVLGWLAQLLRDAGYPAQTAGLLLAVVTALGVPISLLLPALAARLPTLRPLVYWLHATTLVACLGLIFAPYGPALLWVVLLGIGQGSFPLILTTIGLRARTAQGTVALSAFTQGVGYVSASLGPLLVGLLYEVSGGWLAPIGFLIGALVLQTIAGLIMARPRHIEDEPQRWTGGVRRWAGGVPD